MIEGKLLDKWNVENLRFSTHLKKKKKHEQAGSKGQPSN